VFEKTLFNTSRIGPRLRSLASEKGFIAPISAWRLCRYESITGPPLTAGEQFLLA
jgi:hypothetical protein